MMDQIYTGLLTLIISMISVLLGTKTVTEFLERYLLNGVPQKISDADIELINRYLKDDEIKVNNVLGVQPTLVFEPYMNCPDLKDAVDNTLAKKYKKDQLDRGFPDDPHAFTYTSHDFEKIHNNEDYQLHAYVIDGYSKLRAIPKEKKHKILVIGSNNLVLSPKENNFIFHVRGPSETQSNKLHGFGGGYMPYWENGEKTIAIRRDDCKNLRYTAMRELHEESGLLSLNHIQDMVCAIEERHIKDSENEGKFGYLSFFYVTLINDSNSKFYKGESKEGRAKRISINFKNLREMIIHKKFDTLEIHPQLQAMLILWFFSGCPGLHIMHRLRLSNFYTKYLIREALN